MLLIVKSMDKLPTRPLMEICQEVICEEAARTYFDLPPGIGMEYAELDVKDYLEQVFFKEKGAYIAFWFNGKQYVSTLRMMPYMDGILLHSLNTMPGCRRCGYGATLVREVLAREKGSKIYSHVKKENLPSILLHQKLGFRKILDHAVYLDGSRNENAVTFCMDRH